MKLFVKAEKKNISELKDLPGRITQAIQDGYVIKEEIEEIKLERYSTNNLEIKDTFYSLIAFDQNTEIKLTRDGEDLYFRQISENNFNGVKEIEISNSSERSCYLKGKYDKSSGKWWETRFLPEFDYPKEDNEHPPDESRARLKIKIYQDQEGEILYFRFCGYEVASLENKEEENARLEHLSKSI